MSILDFDAPKKATATRRTAGSNADRPQAKNWLNIGYEVNGRFVNLPLGMPLDTMEPLAVTGQNADWVAFTTARNDLLKKLQALGDKLQPGEEVDVPVLTIKIRRVNEALAADAGEYAINLDDAFASLVPTKPQAPGTKQDEAAAEPGVEPEAATA